MPAVATPFPYRSAPGLTAPEPRHPVAIVGAGPTGLAMGLELARHGVASVILDDNDVVAAGSRAICWSKRSLEICDRIGVGQRMVDKGVTWQVGHTYLGEEEVFRFDLLPEAGHKRPAFVNLQQYHVERFMVEAAQAEPLVDLRFRNRVAEVAPRDDHVALRVATPEGDYPLEAGHLVACDGARSPVREMLGLSFDGALFEERFLIADVVVEADFPADRRFWFEPPFHPGQSVLLHKQPDNLYRIDFKLGPDADPEAETRPEAVIPRVRRVLGEVPFTLDWVSVYSFQCRRLARFVHGRVIFAGDSAHVVSPFGARGGNGGLQDVDNLGWKLAAVAQGRAGPALLDGYDRERVQAADENIAHSTRATRFIAPADGVERLFRDAVLALAREAPFARPLVNSGRLSTPCIHACAGSDDPALPAASRPGAVAPDAPLADGWLIDRLGRRPVLLALNRPAPAVPGLEPLELTETPELRARYLGDSAAALCLVRPDQVVAARWQHATAEEVADALAAMWEGR